MKKPPLRALVYERAHVRDVIDMRKVGFSASFWRCVDQSVVDEDLDLAATLEDHLSALRTASGAPAVLGSSGRDS